MANDVMNLLLSNVRSRREVFGDLRAQMSANDVAIRRLDKMTGKYSLPTLNKFSDELLSYTDRWVEAEIRKLPEGTYRAESFRDDDGISDDPIHIKVAVILKDGRATLDITGTSAQVEGPLNATRLQTRRPLQHVLRCLSDPRIPHNSGFLDRVQVAGPGGPC